MFARASIIDKQGTGLNVLSGTSGIGTRLRRMWLKTGVQWSPAVSRRPCGRETLKWPLTRGKDEDVSANGSLASMRPSSLSKPLTAWLRLSVKPRRCQCMTLSKPPRFPVSWKPCGKARGVSGPGGHLVSCGAVKRLSSSISNGTMPVARSPFKTLYPYCSCR